MTTFYEELYAAAKADYTTTEREKQAVLQVVRRWAENNKIIDAALAEKIRLEMLVGPIISPNLRISFFNRENGILDSSGFKEWSEELFRQLRNILPLEEKAEASDVMPLEDPIKLWLPVKAYRFYNPMRHLFACFILSMILLPLWNDFPTSTFWKALVLVIGVAGGSFVELIVFCLNTSLHCHTRRKMARELLRQTRNIDRIFRVIRGAEL